MRTLIYLVRHGETEWSLSGRHTGRMDIPLTPRGEEEARRLALRLNNISFARVFTSPLQRARRTSELAGFPAEALPDLAEWNYGDYEGLTLPEIKKTSPDWDPFHKGCPGGESVQDISERGDRVAAFLRATAGTILVFSHGHFLRVLAARWTGLTVASARPLALSTTAISVLGYEGDNPQTPALLLWNDRGTLPQ